MAWWEPWRFPFDGGFFQLDLECFGDWQLGSRSTQEDIVDAAIDELCERTEFYHRHMPWAKTAAISTGDLEDDDRPTTREIRAKIAAERPEVVKRDSDLYIHFLESDVIPRLVRIHKGTDYGLLGGLAGHHWKAFPEPVKVGDVECHNSVEYCFARTAHIAGKPCVYLGEMTSYVDFRFDRILPGGGTIVVKQIGMIQHGDGGGQTASSTVNKLNKTAVGWDADFYVRGHDCQLLAMKVDQFRSKEPRGEGTGGLKRKTKSFLNIGAATDGYEITKKRPAYPEQGGLNPRTMGWGTTRFRLYKGRDFEDADGSMICTTKLEI